MGRITGYDRGTLVRTARDLFWQRGFDAVSVADMEAATGVGRSSIYHAFGNMRGLFDAAVADYLDTVVRPRLIPLSCEPPAPRAILDYLTGLRSAIADLDPAAPHGCLLLISSSSPIGTDDAVHDVIEAYHGELCAAIGRGITALLPDADPDTVARLTRLSVAANVAALTLARVDPSAACATLDSAVATLRAEAT